MYEIVTIGNKLPFIKFPVAKFQDNHRISLPNKNFVNEAIKELKGSRCITQVEECPTVCSPLQVVTNAKGKQRFVIHLRYINIFLQKCKFKYEGLDVAAEILEKDDSFTTFDLKSGYHHEDIHQDFWKYLGFSWKGEDTRKFYVFKVLPFGLATACYVFTKLLRPLVKRWRSFGLSVVLYIDDGICNATTETKTVVDTARIIEDLDNAGFILNREKSSLLPKKKANGLE